MYLMTNPMHLFKYLGYKEEKVMSEITRKCDFSVTRGIFVTETPNSVAIENIFY